MHTNIKLLTCGLWLMTMPVNAQPVEHKLVLEAGYSYSTQNPTLFNIGAYRSPRFTLHTPYIALHYTYPVNNSWAISGGLQVMEKGFKSFNYSQMYLINSKLDYQYRLEYIQMPITCIRYFAPRRPQKPHVWWAIRGGVYGAYMLDGNYRIEQTDELTRTPAKYYYYNKSVTLNQKFNRYDWRLIIGITRQFNNHFGIKATLQKGFIETNKSGFTELKYNQNFMFGVQYNIL